MIVPFFMFIVLLVALYVTWNAIKIDRAFNSFIPKKQTNMIQRYINDPDYDVFMREGKLEIEHHPERKAEREAFNALSFEEKNKIGHDRGFGSCNHCGGTWNWKRGHSIKTEELRGYAGLCEECYTKLSPQERYDYVVKHAEKYNYKEKVDWELVRKQVDLTR